MAANDFYKKIEIKLQIGDRVMYFGQDHENQIMPGLEGIEEIFVEYSLGENYNYPGNMNDYEHIPYREIVLPFRYLSLGNTEEKRQEYRRFFNPYFSGLMTVNYAGHVKQIGFEVKSRKESGGRTLWEPLEVEVELICEDPFFAATTKSSAPIYTWMHGWSWPFTIPFQFREKGDTRQIIHNGGDVPTPIEVVFPGVGLNPKIINHTTGEFFQINIEIKYDQIMYVRTHYEEKEVLIYDADNPGGIDAFDKINLDGDFFDLQIGDNDIEFQCDEPDKMPQGVIIIHREKYLGA